MVQSIIISSGIAIKYVGGVKPDGKDIIKSQTFNTIRSDMTDAEIFAVGKAITSLMVDRIVDIRKTLEYTLIES